MFLGNLFIVNSLFFLSSFDGKWHSSESLKNTGMALFCLNLIKVNFQRIFSKSLKSEFISYMTHKSVTQSIWMLVRVWVFPSWFSLARNPALLPVLWHLVSCPHVLATSLLLYRRSGYLSYNSHTASPLLPAPLLSTKRAGSFNSLCVAFLWGRRVMLQGSSACLMREP